jgi:hypothetical protein
MVNKKKINKKQLSVSERHFGVVLERINSKIDLLLSIIANTLTKLEKYGN